MQLHYIWKVKMQLSHVACPKCSADYLSYMFFRLWDTRIEITHQKMIQIVSYLKSEKIDWNRYWQIVIIMTSFKKIFILVTFFLRTSFCAELFDFGIFENFVANGKIFEAEVQIIHRLREIRGLLKSVSRYERVFWLLYTFSYRLILMQNPGRGPCHDTTIWA